MKIISLLASNNEHGLSKSATAIYEIFSELGIDVLEIDLTLPLYNGQLCAGFLDIMEKADGCNGIMVATTSNLFGPCAKLYNFLSYLENYYEKNIFQNKNCLVLAVSESGGEKNTLDFMSRYINYFEGFDSVKIGLNKSAINDLDKNNELKDIFEKQIEDFYRLVRQNRKFFIPREASYSNISSNLQIFDRIANIEKFNTGNRVSINELLQKYDSQSDDEAVFEIAKFYESKLGSSSATEKKLVNVDKFYLDDLSPSGNVLVRLKNYQQKTKNLPHYYKGGLSLENPFMLQLIISEKDSGTEYECYLRIDNAGCEYFEGHSNSPDIVIYSKSTVWEEILSGKRTAQKSFMTGQLKVKGNFVLLTKFDQLFNPIV
ncbi:MAG: SCP2 sterol-binding domain-containing protein [Clostridiales bacterium]|jgi:NAD(P)H-dependent FMN reductase|nr:SCP2 sterol-binding domain-containing protein [Clostridiales bacterium]